MQGIAYKERRKIKQRMRPKRGVVLNQKLPSFIFFLAFQVLSSLPVTQLCPYFIKAAPDNSKQQMSLCSDKTLLTKIGLGPNFTHRPQFTNPCGCSSEGAAMGIQRKNVPGRYTQHLVQLVSTIGYITVITNHYLPMF